jgi:hypothetical protein
MVVTPESVVKLPQAVKTGQDHFSLFVSQRRKAACEKIADGFPVNCLDCPEPGVSVVCRLN